MRRPLLFPGLVAFACSIATSARAREIDYAEVLAIARATSPELTAVRTREAIGRAGVRVAGVLPNPTFTIATYTETAKLAVDATLALPLFGQRDAAIHAGAAELDVMRADTRVAASDVRWASARAFVALWYAERIAEARHDAAAIAARTDDAVNGRVDAGTAPELDRLRAHAERLRAEADALDADARTTAAGSELGRWLGIDGADLQARGDADVPSTPPSLESLEPRIASNPLLTREHMDALAALARADHERALARPLLVFGLGASAFDPTVPRTDFHASLGFEVPIVSWRKPMVDRERATAAAADARREADRVRFFSELNAAYRIFTSSTARANALETGVVPAIEAAAVASREAYALGHSPLLVVLEAERARIDGKLELFTAKADRANAWIDVQRATGAL